MPVHLAATSYSRCRLNLSQPCTAIFVAFSCTHHSDSIVGRGVLRGYLLLHPFDSPQSPLKKSLDHHNRPPQPPVMASPPGYSYSPTALSPAYPSHAQLPPINTMSTKKRPSEGGGPPTSLKRRKASQISLASAAGGGSAHPLRQTSFPPDEAGTPFSVRSPSVDFDNMSLISGSQVSAAGPPKKKRGRKSKAEKAREQTPSVAGGRGNIAGSDVGGRAGTKGSAAGADEEDGEAVENDGPTEVTATVSSVTKEEAAAERKAMNVLIRTFSEEIFQRYEFWRSAGLQKASIRKVITQTLPV